MYCQDGCRGNDRHVHDFSFSYAGDILSRRNMATWDREPPLMTCRCFLPFHDKESERQKVLPGAPYIEEATDTATYRALGVINFYDAWAIAHQSCDFACLSHKLPSSGRRMTFYRFGTTPTVIEVSTRRQYQNATIRNSTKISDERSQNPSISTLASTRNLYPVLSVKPEGRLNR
ncbi:hypothetical protein BELL_0705g00050 [Botrytis elliptica]|uniref:Uncharacterized protein n=1 Tax=Botrytis elliptica TaxID=278938 RepID=A0A4Z1JA30_9HELO|nr:hypothetical protein BELL_0705g00050 [Botrytis elliptica]